MKKPIIIPRRHITHLFWGIYPYKVEIQSVHWNPPQSTKGYFEAYNKKIKALRNRCLKFMPKDKTCWKSTETYQSLYFYFNMLEFISGNEKRIKTITEPENEKLVDFFNSTAKNTFIRLTLFHNKYRHCIRFKSMNSIVRKEMDEWVEEMFGTQSGERSYYNNYGYYRVLYLRDEIDIMLVRLAFSAQILKIQNIILRSEIKNECTISEKID
jgi:hypothetical protein